MRLKTFKTTDQSYVWLHAKVRVCGLELQPRLNDSPFFVMHSDNEAAFVTCSAI